LFFINLSPEYVIVSGDKSTLITRPVFGEYYNLLILRCAVLGYIRCLLAGCRLPSGKYGGILTDYRTKVKKKMKENSLTYDGGLGKIS